MPLFKKIKKNKSNQSRKFLKDYRNISKIISLHNQIYINKVRKKYSILDNINGYPLDDYQSRVVISEETSTLVIAGAGSGKSLTIIGKIIYLVKIKKINPQDILCISFTNDATNNLKNKIYENYHLNIDIYTFHKLALEILKQNNISYLIAPENYLEQITDLFFDEIIPNNQVYQKALTYILGRRYSTYDIFSLKQVIKTFINLFKSNNYSISYFLVILRKIHFTFNIKEYYKNKYILLLIINIYLLYENELQKENALDFNDMINKCITLLKKNPLKKHWQYIIIDEYQDTSLTKFNFINEIIKQTSAKFLAVGDDFQSIYRFTGCDLSIFLNFSKYFKDAKIFHIINTYRNPQELINVAGNFIMKNKKQQRKKLVSSKHLTKPIIIYYDDNKIRALKYLLEQISSKEIMVLGRNNKDINNYLDQDFIKENDFYFYNNIKFRYLTVHKSKGLESDNVILINLIDSIIGFPSQKQDEKIIHYVNNYHDNFPYEEERRLFYVALTRTKNKTYIICPYQGESIFIKEIKKYSLYVETIKKK